MFGRGNRRTTVCNTAKPARQNGIDSAISTLTPKKRAAPPNADSTAAAASRAENHLGKVSAARSGDGRHAAPNRARTPCARMALLAVITIQEAAIAPGVTKARRLVNASLLDPLSSTKRSTAG